MGDIKPHLWAYFPESVLHRSIYLGEGEGCETYLKGKLYCLLGLLCPWVSCQNKALDWGQSHGRGKNCDPLKPPR